jgi:predicted HTH transcriptional regulator
MHSRGNVSPSTHSARQLSQCKSLITNVELTNINRSGVFWFESFSRFVLTLKYGLSERQKAAVGLALRQPAFGIQDLEALLPGVHRRTLQRELKELLDQGVFVASGATRNLSYSLAK